MINDRRIEDSHKFSSGRFRTHLSVWNDLSLRNILCSCVGRLSILEEALSATFLSLPLFLIKEEL